MSERYNNGDFASEMCVGCTAHHWAVASRALVCILTIGLSELLRGKDGWCGFWFSPEGGSRPVLPRPPYQSQFPTEREWSPRMTDMENDPRHRTFSYPIPTYNQGELDREICGSFPQPQSPATGAFPLPQSPAAGSFTQAQSLASGEQFGSPPPVSPIAQ
ncbi:hypothetical protein FOMG_17092 [Fusarium oxysporum f. sp. melonis 26406]|uniref:Uncharacterized protein n=1 Tax=Fusarium oxysporum f. sp. melonis 26406 TaxID=1089452 RepID=W9Z4N9_FUSOX|nr:hypothetical protein FOMG_17092 [Fusarium oxysporum f. sp. melonis 26406]